MSEGGKDNIPRFTEYGLPVVNADTIKALQADINSRQHSTTEWASILEKEQPDLFNAVKSLALGHGGYAPEVFRDIVVIYMALRKQAKANKLSSSFKLR